MFFILSKVFAFLFRPIIWVFILLLLSFFFKKRRKKLLCYSIITFWFFSNAFICDEVARIWEYKAVGIENIKENFDVGIVLGGMSEYDFKYKMLNFNNHADRLIFTEKLYHKGTIKKILISGGSGKLINDGYREAIAIKTHLINNGIAKNDIIIEENSRNTKENTLYTANILKQEFKNGKFLLITSANHMRRSLLCFKKAGVKVIPFPTDNTNSDRDFQLDYLLLPNSETFERWEALIHEWVGYVVYRVTF
jgi:uncharacterized SAM-binding protein YcdF (DUF218 family)